MPLDIGVGILLALGVAELFHAHSTPLFVLLSVACALLPDIDIVTLPLLGKWHHRSYTHYPFIYIPFAVLVYVLAGPLYGTLFTLGVYAHLIHDTFGIGWGVAWLWPFSSRRFLLFPEKSRGIRSGPLVVWEEDVQTQPVSLAGEKDWIRQYYFQPNIVAYIEYGVLLVALATTAVYFR